MTRAPDVDCARLLTAISAYLDGDLDATACADIEQHCASCARCAALVGSLQQTVGLCRQAAAAPLPDAIRERAQSSVRRLLESLKSGAGPAGPEGRT